MNEAENLFGQEHVRRYRETNGEIGHIWRRGSKILLLTTKGRNTGEPRTTPLIYEDADSNYVVVAFEGRRAGASRLVREPRQGTAGRATGEGRGFSRSRPDGDRRRA
jgi:hypothetical protein